MLSRLQLAVLLTLTSSPFAAGLLSSSLPFQSTLNSRSAQLNAHFTQGLARPEKDQAGSLPSFPFKPGEKLVYDIGFQKSILSGTVGQLELEVRYPTDAAQEASSAGPGRRIDDKTDSHAADGPPSNPRGSDSDGEQAQSPPNNEEIELEGTLISKGFYTWVLGVNVQDTYDSIVSTRDLSLSRFVKITDQSNLHRREETFIDRGHGLATYTDTDSNNPSAQPKVKVVSCPPWVLDILSAFYFVRTQDLKEGQTLTIPLTDSGRVFDVDLVAGKYETVDFKSGKTKALPVDVRIFDGRYVRRSGRLIVWLADGPTHVPVRARVKTNGLTINVVLERLAS